MHFTTKNSDHKSCSVLYARGLKTRGSCISIDTVPELFGQRNGRTQNSFVSIPITETMRYLKLH